MTGLYVNTMEFPGVDKYPRYRVFISGKYDLITISRGPQSRTHTSCVLDEKLGKRQRKKYANFYLPW